MKPTRKKAVKRRKVNRSIPSILSEPDVSIKKGFKIKIPLYVIIIAIFIIVLLALFLFSSDTQDVPDYMTSQRRDAIHMSESIDETSSIPLQIQNPSSGSSGDNFFTWIINMISTQPVTIAIVIGVVFVMSNALGLNRRRNNIMFPLIIIGALFITYMVRDNFGNSTAATSIPSQEQTIQEQPRNNNEKGLQEQVQDKFSELSTYMNTTSEIKSKTP